jgi:hypothetical protein
MVGGIQYVGIGILPSAKWMGRVVAKGVLFQLAAGSDKI